MTISSGWAATEVKDGKFTVTNGDIAIEVFKDFSGEVTNDAGDFIVFRDLRSFIEAAKLLESALVQHYGRYK